MTHYCRSSNKETYLPASWGSSEPNLDFSATWLITTNFIWLEELESILARDQPALMGVSNDEPLGSVVRAFHPTSP